MSAPPTDALVRELAPGPRVAPAGLYHPASTYDETAML